MGHRIVRAMFVIIFFQFFWKFGGLIITLLVGSVFKASAESDAYLFVSKNVVFLLQTLCLKIFLPVVVPIFKEQLGEASEEDAWRFGNTVLNLTIVLLAITTVAGMLFAPQITALVGEGFNERQATLSTRLMRIMFPGVFAICLATVTYALLNSYNVFGYAAAGDAVQKMLWAGVFFAASLTGLALMRMLDAIGVAFLLGAAATLITHLIGLRSKLGYYRPGLPGLPWRRIGVELAILVPHAVVLGGGVWGIARWGAALSEGEALALQQLVLLVVVSVYLLQLWWRARGRPEPMAKFAALTVPLLFGILFAKYRDLLTSRFASFTGTGVFSDLEYARKIGEAPNTLVIAALSVAILPHLCELATGKRWDEFGDVMTHTIRTVVLYFVPLAALTIVLRRPVVQLLFDRGDWTHYHLAHAGDALGLYILALPFFAIENPIQQSFFAMQRMWTPTLIGFLGTGFHVVFLFVGIEWLGFGYFVVVALVYAAARAFKNVILLLVMRSHVRI
ncbi:MAG: lipid II flippase MurJ, partial [Planctomycetota bacterium]